MSQWVHDLVVILYVLITPGAGYSGMKRTRRGGDFFIDPAFPGGKASASNYRDMMRGVS